MKIAVTMRACDRSPGPNYLHNTLANARRAGIFESPITASFDIVLSHPRTEYITETLKGFKGRLTVPDGKRTPNECATLAHSQAEGVNADYVMFMEDDLDFCDDFMGSVARWLEAHDNGVYPMFVFGHVRAGGRGGCLPWRVNQFYGTQCYVIPKAHHVGLVEWLQAHPLHDNGKRVVTRCHDLRLEQWGAAIGAKEFLCSAPSFVDHIGEVSGMGCPPVIFKSFPGRDWSYKGRAAA